MGPASGDRVIAEVDGLDRDGAGTASASSTLMHVPGALPGERAAVTIEHVSPHVDARTGIRAAWARLDVLERSSPERVEPVCPAHGSCGGCVLQHLDYAAQVRWKTSRVATELAAHPRLAQTPVQPCVPSPFPVGYRNQAKYVVGGAAGRLVTGAYRPRTHQLVDLAGCRLVESPIDEVVTALRELASERGIRPFDERLRTGELRHVAVRVSARGQALVTLVTGSIRGGIDQDFGAELRRRRAEVVGVVLNHNPSMGNAVFGTDERTLDGKAQLEDEVAGVRVRLSSRSFFQLNRHVAALAYQAMSDAIVSTATPGRLVDAYGGAGPIGLMLAPSFADVVGIENNPAAAADAVRAAASARLDQVRVVVGDVAVRMGELDQADAVVLNPPRAGCAPAVLASVQRIGAQIVAYLSCDPGTLARDLDRLVEGGFTLRSVQPFDMLPHTTHVETLAILQR